MKILAINSRRLARTNLRTSRAFQCRVFWRTLRDGFLDQLRHRANESAKPATRGAFVSKYWSLRRAIKTRAPKKNVSRVAGEQKLTSFVLNGTCVILVAPTSCPRLV